MIWLRQQLVDLSQRTGSESGSALVLALIFMVLFGLGIAALLGFAETSFRHTIAVQEQGEAAYDADGAIEGAIDYLISDPTVGNDGGPCPSFSMDQGSGTTVTVDCSALPGSGAITGPSVTTTPEYAVLTTSHRMQYDEDGYRQNNNSEFRIDGPVFSNSNLAVAGGFSSTLVVRNGTVGARLPCSGSISPACSIVTTVEEDPAYASLAPALFVDQPLPPCLAGVATFDPGRYTSADALGRLSCAAFKFPAGVYYFDFADSGPPSARKWTSDGPDITGGTYNASTGNCDAGVQFIFGGESQWEIKDGHIDLCPITPVPDGQRIALYAAGSILRLRSTGAVNENPNFSPFTPTASALDIDGSTSAVTLTGNANGRNSQLRLNGYGTSQLAGSNISSARLIVTHRETPNGAGTRANDATLSLTITDALARTSTFTLTTDDSLHSDVIQLGSTWNDPASLPNVTVEYRARVGAGKNLTEQLDGIWLEIIYANSPLSPATGCLISLSSGCPLLSTSKNKAASMIEHGTVYAPASRFEISLNNVQEQIFKRGVILRGLTVDITASSSFAGSAISLSTTSNRDKRTVLLVAKDASGRSRLRALVEIGIAPVFKVKVLSWRVIR